MANTGLSARGGALPARGFSPSSTTASSSRARAATTPALADAPAGASSTTQEQKRHAQPACVCGDASAGTLAASASAPSRSTRAQHSQAYPTVTGYGPQAHAALVDALLEAGETEIAREVAGCGAMPLPFAAHVTVHACDGRRHMGGLAHCGRFQLCPICTPYLMARRLEALEPIGARLAADEGLRHFSVVLSIRHYHGADWKTLVHALRKMQTALRAGHRWKAVVEGYLRLLESTFGRNGHHPHEHLLLTVRADAAWDAEGFFSWVQQLCEHQARKAGRTCDFTPGWWSEVSRDRLAKAVRYLGAADKMGTAGANPLLELSTSTKHQPLWCIPTTPYAEVYRASKGMRWFGTGGCWTSKATAKTDEELDAEREQTGTVIAHIARETWRSWTPRERRDRRAVVSDRTLTDAQVVEYLVACGAVAGPPPVPDWGEQVLRDPDPPPMTG